MICLPWCEYDLLLTLNSLDLLISPELVVAHCILPTLRAKGARDDVAFELLPRLFSGSSPVQSQSGATTTFCFSVLLSVSYHRKRLTELGHLLFLVLSTPVLTSCLENLFQSCLYEMLHSTHHPSPHNNHHRFGTGCQHGRRNIKLSCIQLQASRSW